MVNHVTTNSFFTATIYGIQDACAITGCTYQWTGSANSIVSQMVAAMNSATAAKANGIGCCLISDTAFNAPTNAALSRGIPVIAYNADVSAGVANNRMSYVGQNNLTAGAAVAAAILKTGKVKKGDLVAGIIATPGTGNIQPRIDGAKPVLAKAGVDFMEVGTSATEGSPEYNKISSWYAGHKNVKFMFGVDSGDSNAIAQFIQQNNLKGKVGGSGWDVGTPVVQGIKAGNLTFTIDQQAYLQGFDTIMQLFLYNVSGGLMKPTNTDTGLGIVYQSNVGPYLAKNRFQGTSSAQQTLKPPASIPH
jgi:simple sugar transport system substrate-binding protein